MGECAPHPSAGLTDATALVLFAHGARDPRWAEPLTHLAAAVRARQPEIVVEAAFLELMTPDLTTVLDALAADGHRRVNILPVFWSAGGHVIRDLPKLLDDVRQRHPGMTLAVLPVLSELPGVIDAIARGALPQA